MGIPDYCGTAMAVRIFGFFYLATAGAGSVIELVFRPRGLIPATRSAGHRPRGSWNYTTWLNIAFLVLPPR